MEGQNEREGTASQDEEGTSDLINGGGSSHRPQPEIRPLTYYPLIFLRPDRHTSLRTRRLVRIVATASSQATCTHDATHGKVELPQARRSATTIWPTRVPTSPAPA